MDIKRIDEAFKKMIGERNVHRKLGLPSGSVRTYRFDLAHGKPISLEKKIELLGKAGQKLEAPEFTRKDLISLLNYNNRTSQSARQKGPEHIIENWERSPQRRKK